MNKDKSLWILYINDRSIVKSQIINMVSCPLLSSPCSLPKPQNMILNHKMEMYTLLCVTHFTGDGARRQSVTH